MKNCSKFTQKQQKIPVDCKDKKTKKNVLNFSFFFTTFTLSFKKLPSLRFIITDNEKAFHVLYDCIFFHFFLHLVKKKTLK